MFSIFNRKPKYDPDKVVDRGFDNLVAARDGYLRQHNEWSDTAKQATHYAEQCRRMYEAMNNAIYTLENPAVNVTLDNLDNLEIANDALVSFEAVTIADQAGEGSDGEITPS